MLHFILTSCSDGSVSCSDSYEAVAYSGQAALATAKDLYDAMNADMTVTRADLDALVDNDNSKLYTKTAENDINRDVIIGHLNGILDDYAANSAAFEAGTVASAGVAGINASGYELNTKRMGS